MSEELTNLNWLSLTPIEIDKCQSKSPDEPSTADKQSPSCSVVFERLQEASIKSDTRNDLHRVRAEQKRLHRKVQVSSLQRPRCSYSCLIAMALKASESGCLPVHLIYKYIEQEFPFFKTAPEGWKNSIRHNLSMNQNFIKVSKDDVQTKKGFFWAINPDRMDALDQEIEKTLKAIGRRLNENTQLSLDLSLPDSMSCSALPPAEYQDSFSHKAPLLNNVPSVDSFQCITNNIHLDTLNSLIGLETRGRVDQNSNTFELSPTIQKQSSLEAIYSLFGISLAPQEHLGSSHSSEELAVFV